MNNLNEIVDNIYVMLEYQNKSKYSLESYLGVSRGYFSRIKNKDADIGFMMLNKIADFLQVSVESLVNENYSKQIECAKLKAKILALDAEKTRLENKIKEVLKND